MSSGDHHRAGGDFRPRLDTVLRRRDPSALRAFLIAEGQWEAEAPTDAEAAMWMMIAASPVLADLHAEAERWLMTHGHEHEARAILGGKRKATRPARGAADTSTEAGRGSHTRHRAPESDASGRRRPSSGNPRKPRG